MKKQQKRAGRGRIAVALASAALCLVLLEGSFWVYHAIKDMLIARAQPPVAQRALVPSDDPALVYEFNRNFRKGAFTTNAYGMADAPTALRKRPGVTRIAIVGDSISANFDLLPRDVIYPTLLESDSVETLNFAVNGYSILQSQHMARTRVPAFAPDVLIAQLCLNDPRPSHSLYTPLTPPARLHIVRFLRSRLTPHRFAATEYIEQLYDDAGWANIRTGFEGLAEFQRDHAPVLAVLFPFLYAPAYTDWGFESYHAGYRREAQRAGIELLDLTDAFLSAGMISDDPGEHLHPDARGHRIAAQRIARALERRGWLPAGG